MHLYKLFECNLGEVVCPRNQLVWHICDKARGRINSSLLLRNDPHSVTISRSLYANPFLSKNRRGLFLMSRPRYQRELSSLLYYVCSLPKLGPELSLEKKGNSEQVWKGLDGKSTSILQARHLQNIPIVWFNF